MQRLNYYHEAVTAIANVIADREQVGDAYELHDRLEDIEQQVNDWLGDAETAALNGLIEVARDVLDNAWPA